MEEQKPCSSKKRKCNQPPNVEAQTKRQCPLHRLDSATSRNIPVAKVQPFYHRPLQNDMEYIPLMDVPSDFFTDNSSYAYPQNNSNDTHQQHGNIELNQPSSSISFQPLPRSISMALEIWKDFLADYLNSVQTTP